MPAIEWLREPRRVLVPIIVLAPFPVTDLTGVSGKALLDTGSSVSGVSTAVAEDLGLARLGKRPLTSAQGQGQIERYAFRVGMVPAHASGATPAFPFVFDEVVGIELTNAFEFDARLGMDILRQCDFSMDRTGRCRLAFG
jgi:hypothetical protein